MMTNVIYLSKPAINLDSFCTTAQTAATPTLDELLATRDLLAEGMRSLCQIQMLLEGMVTTAAASEEQWKMLCEVNPAEPDRL